MVAVIAVGISSSQPSLDSILANRNCKALEKYGETEIYDTNVTPEQSKKILEVAGYCAGKVLKNMYDDDSKTTSPELKPSAILDPKPIIPETKPTDIKPIDKELLLLEEMIATDEEIIALQKINDELPTLPELADSSGLNKSEARIDYENVVNIGDFWARDSLDSCNSLPVNHNDISLLGCYYFRDLTITSFDFRDLYDEMSKNYEADSTYVYDTSDYTNSQTVKRVNDYFDKIKRFDKYAKIYIKYQEMINDIDDRIEEWEIKTRSKIVETFYDKAETVDNLTIRTTFKNEIETCDLKYGLYSYKEQMIKSSKLLTCLSDANEKYGNSE